MNNKNIIKNKKLRFGAMSLGFIAFFIAIVIVLNGIFSVLAAKFGWYVDMTGEKVFSISDAAAAYLTDITSEVNIYFAAEPDELMADDDMRYVYTSATELESKFSNIHVECHDAVKNPEFFTEFYTNKGTDITAKSVVIESGTESIVYNYKAFFTYNENGDRWAYNGEYRYVAGIMQLTQAEVPIAYFTTGHSEDVEAASALATLLYDCGFDVRQIDLSTEKIDDDARIIVIFNPKYDFHGINVEDESANEIAKLDEFLNGLGGVMVFEDSEYASGLTNLNEFLEEWGISYKTGTQVKDGEHSMSVDGYTIVTEYAKDDTFGNSVYSDLANFDSMPKSVIRQAMPIEKVWPYQNTMSGAKGIYSMLSSYDGAELIDRADNTTLETGKYDLVTISYENRVIDNDYYYSYVMAAGSPSFAYNNYLVDGSYGNSDIIYSALKLIGRDRVLGDLDTKPFDDTSSDATTAQAKALTFWLTFPLPAVIALAGVVTVVRRRRA